MTLIYRNSTAENKNDFPAVASLHKRAISQGFLSTLGEEFLARLYAGIARHPLSCVIVAQDEYDKIIGFIAGSLSTSLCYRHVIMRNFIRLGMPIFFKLFSLVNLNKIRETLAYGLTGRDAAESVTAELLSIVVADEARGTGVGRQLVNHLEHCFREKNFSGTYKVVTSARDERSNHFYRNLGFRFLRSFMHHRNIMNEYHKNI